MEPHRMLALFLAEGRDLLDRVDAELLLLERTPDARRALDGIFRALHSLKGMSATVALDATARALHSGESLLAIARDAGRIEPPQLAALLTLSDTVRRALDAADGGHTEPPALGTIAAQLDALVGGAVVRADPTRDRAHAAARVQQATTVVDARWRIDLTLDDACAIPMARATVIRRRLAGLADVLAVAPDDDAQADSRLAASSMPPSRAPAATWPSAPPCARSAHRGRRSLRHRRARFASRPVASTTSSI
jgi:two-component system, chemotaxis family, sensor kinase CheA